MLLVAGGAALAAVGLGFLFASKRKKNKTQRRKDALAAKARQVAPPVDLSNVQTRLTGLAAELADLGKASANRARAIAAEPHVESALEQARVAVHDVADRGRSRAQRRWGTCTARRQMGHGTHTAVWRGLVLAKLAEQSAEVSDALPRGRAGCMAELKLNGTTIAFDDVGAGEPAFVFLHGWACDRRSVGPQVADLSRHRCIAVDFRGRGDSPPTPPFDAPTAAEDVAALIRELNVGPVVLVGHSLGGLVALLVNFHHPGPCSRHRNGRPRRSPPRPAAGFSTTVERLRESGSTDTLTALMDSFFVDETPAEVRSLVEDMMLKCPTDVAAGMLDNAGIFQSSMGELIAAADKKPFMAIWAATPRGNPERLREVTLFLRQEPMGEAGHFFQLEHPKVTTALLRAFLDDVERDPRVAKGDTP